MNYWSDTSYVSNIIPCGSILQPFSPANIESEWRWSKCHHSSANKGGLAIRLRKEVVITAWVGFTSHRKQLKLEIGDREITWLWGKVVIVSGVAFSIWCQKKTTEE